MVLCLDYLGELVQEETFADHQPSSTSFLHLLRSVATSLFNLHVWQFLHKLSPSLLWSASWFATLHFILHTFLHPVLSYFRNTCPYHCNLFCCSTEIMSSILSLSLNFQLGTLSFTITSHIHLTILISECWSAFSLSFVYNILLCTQLLEQY